MKDEDKAKVNLLKILSMDMIDAAKSGYPGISLGASSIIYTLFTYHLNIVASNPDWLDRDRLVLSAAHCSALVYANMFMAGYDISLDDLKQYRKLDSKLPGLFDMLKTNGVDLTTGPAGYGFSAAVGMAIGEKYYQGVLSKYIKKQKLLDHYIYCVVSDGDVQSGALLEAASLAGLYNLGNLIVIYDSNGIMMDTSVDKTSIDDVLKKFSSMGWQTDYVAEGDSVDKIDKAIKRAKRVVNKPSFIEIKTVLGKDSFNQNTSVCHDHPLTKDDLENLKHKYGFSNEKFNIDEKSLEDYRKKIQNRVKTKYKLWNEYHDAMIKYPSEEIRQIVAFADKKELNLDFDVNSFKIQSTFQEELIESNNKILNIIASRTPYFLGGSADASSMCRVNLNKEANFSAKNNTGKNLLFGCREGAMSSILAGIASYGFHVFGATNLRYAYQELDNIKMAALMHLPVTYIFSHDGFSLARDGSAVSSFEVLNILRSIPYLDVYRPCDINEVIGCWGNILHSKNTSSLVLTSEITHILKGSNASLVNKGAYIIRHEETTASATILSSGYDVTLAYVIAEELKSEGIDLRIVSVPCKNIFDKAEKAYKDSLLAGKVIVIESSTEDIWCRYAPYENIIGISEVLPCGSVLDATKKLGFDKESVKNKIKTILTSK